MHSSSIFYNTNWVCMQQNLIFYLQMFSKTLVRILPIVLCILSNLISIALFYRLLKQDATELASLSNLSVSVFCLWSYNRPYAILGAWLCSIDRVQSVTRISWKNTIVTSRMFLSSRVWAFKFFRYRISCSQEYMRLCSRLHIVYNNKYSVLSKEIDLSPLPHHQHTFTFVPPFKQGLNCWSSQS